MLVQYILSSRQSLHIRGCTSASKHQEVPTDTANRSDFCFALTRHSVPIFPILAPPSSSKAFHYAIAPVYVPPELQPLGSALLHEPRYATMLSPEILPVYADLRDIIIWQQINILQKDTTVDPLETKLCGNLMLRTEHRLAEFSYISTFETSTSVQIVCRIVIPMFAVQTQLYLWQGTHTMRALVGRLQQILQCDDEHEECYEQEQELTSTLKVNMAILWYEYTDLAIWAFLMGAFASADDRLQRSWFLHHCANGVNRYKDSMGLLLTWTTVKSMLQRFFYVENMHGNEFAELWEEVMWHVGSA